MSWAKVVWRGASLAVLVLIPAVGIGASVGTLPPLPNTFSSGQVISSSQMNANFDQLEANLDAVADVVNQNEAALRHTVVHRKDPANATTTSAFLMCPNGADVTGGGCYAYDVTGPPYVGGVKASFPVTTAFTETSDTDTVAYADVVGSENLDTPAGWACTAASGSHIESIWVLCLE